MEPSARITKIQRFSTHDGPGIRTAVFFKGCPLRCAWCHNPETQRPEPEVTFAAGLCVNCGACAAVCPNGCHRFGEDGHRFDRTACRGCMRCSAACVSGALEACGRQMPLGEILKQVESDRAFYGALGGVTLTGGEPMAQGEAALALLRMARRAGLHTAVETCGFFDEALAPALAETAQLVLYDLKAADDAVHRRYTGVSNERILRNLSLLDARGARIRLRCIMVAGVNMDAESLRGIAAHAGALRHCEGVELLPYHAFGGGKRTLLGGPDDGRPEWIPSAGALRAAAGFLRAQGVRVLRLG